MKERKIALITLSVLIAICVLLSFSYAMYTVIPTNRKDISVTANIPSCAGITLNSDTKITLTGDNTAPVSDAKALSSNNYRYSFTVTNGCSTNATMKVALAPTTTSTMSPRAIKYAIYESTGSQPSTGLFLSDNAKTLSSDIANEVNSVTGDTVVQGYEILSTTLNTNTSKTYYVYVWVDKDEGGLGNNVTMNSTFYGHLVISDYQSLGTDYFVPITLAANMKEASNQTSSQTNGGTYAIVNEGGGLRYEGKDPDNYVCFASSCTDDELYRIIGKFTEMVDTTGDGTADTNQEVVKIIKNTSIGNEYWDNDSSEYAFAETNSESGIKLVNNRINGAIAAPDNPEFSGDSDWSQSSLKNYLNNSWTKPTSAMITTRWYLKTPNNYDTATPDGWLAGEKNGSKYSSNPEYYDAKIGLMYVSDYGYGVLSSNCARTTKIWYGGYNTSGCYNQNWLYLGSNEWTITPTTYFNQTFYVSNNGTAYYVYVVDGAYAVRPTFYLSANNSLIIDGAGSKSNPFILDHYKFKFGYLADPSDYYMDYGMTWSDWINSSYNTGGWYISDNEIYVSSMVSISGATASDLIVHNKTYGYDFHFNKDPGLILF